MRQARQKPATGGTNPSATFQTSRRALLRGGFGMAGAGLLTMSDAVAASEPSASRNQIADIAVFPRPGSRTASPGAEITFRGVPADEIGLVTVAGSVSGAHSGILVPHSDGRGASFVPDAPFHPGESVLVRPGAPLERNSAEGTVRFTVARPAPPPEVPTARAGGEAGDEPLTFRSRPDLMPPPISVTTAAGGTAAGYVFAAVKSGDRQSGPMIVDDRGELVWFDPLPGDVEIASDIRVQRYRGQPVLTWWQGVSQRGHGLGHFVMRDSSYQEIAKFQVANGYPGGDQHEFLLTPQGTALVIIYNPVRWDLSPVGGLPNGVALDSVVQEIDIETGRVLFEWHSLDHIDIDETHRQPPDNPQVPLDYVHVNSIDVDHDGHFIVSARNTSAIYKIDRRTSDVLWRLNGKRSSFTMGAGTPFAYQHDARVQPNGELSLFDNAAESADIGVPSRGMVLDLDTDEMTATLLREYIHPTEIVSVSQGNMQTLPNGNVFIGWGSAPVFSEFDSNGLLRFNGRFPINVISYRAYRFPWIGLPNDAPALVIEPGAADSVTIYVSWNGATEVDTWQVLAGADPDRLAPVGAAPREGFETAVVVQASEPFLAVMARDAAGHVLGISEVMNRDLAEAPESQLHDQD